MARSVPSLVAAAFLFATSACSDPAGPATSGDDPSRRAGPATIPLGDLGGGGTEAIVITNRGWVGGSSVGETGREAFLWTPQEGMRSIHPVDPFGSGEMWEYPTTALDINRRGEVLVASFAEPLPGFLWTRDKGTVYVSEGSEMSINDRGDLVITIEGLAQLWTGEDQLFWFPFVRWAGGESEQVADDAHVALRALHISDRGEILALAAPYEWREWGGTPWLTITGPGREAVWTPDDGFDFERTLEIPDRSVNARGDYVIGDLIHTRNAGRYQVQQRLGSRWAGTASASSGVGPVETLSSRCLPPRTGRPMAGRTVDDHCKPLPPGSRAGRR